MSTAKTVDQESGVLLASNTGLSLSVALGHSTNIYKYIPHKVLSRFLNLDFTFLICKMKYVLQAVNSIIFL